VDPVGDLLGLRSRAGGLGVAVLDKRRARDAGTTYRTTAAPSARRSIFPKLGVTARSQLSATLNPDGPSHG
jgi:hypothetical protein